MSLWEWGQAFLALLFPERCPFCDAISVGGGPCEVCASHDLWESCVRELPEPGNVLCVSPFRYGGEVREAILRFKFRGRRDYAPWFGGEIARELHVSQPTVSRHLKTALGTLSNRLYYCKSALSRANDSWIKYLE